MAQATLHSQALSHNGLMSIEKGKDYLRSRELRKEKNPRHTHRIQKETWHFLSVSTLQRVGEAVGKPEQLRVERVAVHHEVTPGVATRPDVRHSPKNLRRGGILCSQDFTRTGV
jgi:hypothetical protein